MRNQFRNAFHPVTTDENVVVAFFQILFRIVQSVHKINPLADVVAKVRQIRSCLFPQSEGTEISRQTETSRAAPKTSINCPKVLTKR